jgi:flagellar motor switch protein FliM
MSEGLENTTTRPGTEKLLETPKLALDRLPVLTSILERLIATCAERFRELCTIPASFFVNQLEAGNSWDVLESYEDSIAGIYYVGAWDTQMLVGLDRRFIFSLIDAAFGGDGSTPPFETDRPFSAFESRVAKSVLGIVVPAFEELLQPITPVTFELEKVETKLDFQILGPSEIPVVVVQVLFQVLDNGGRMFMIIPQSALHPIRKRLERTRSFDGSTSDPEWTRKMRDGIVSAEVTLAGVLEGPGLTLDDVSRLEVGHIVRLNADAQSLIAVECEGEKLFWCRLAQSKGYFTLVIDSLIDRHQELIGNLIGGPKAG